ncbi:MerR family transcriptional regulator [Octadecabacter sp. G9-8]|uniref:MerR family transcriptional regulator n=1 Tax=Octadecabacter dasysiphoniae TaxID=2909341 RepID=A0ABS9D104_9RHOB|nr:MerR family transcriptional regulator [Octadecabacter dasysiphoniae]MCF2872294.1 MerR family transcriptional regulator [Octadecabacter dasysiphoniae]
MSKSRDAFRTISEVSDVLDTPAHVLRFWESKFTQVKPVKRAGGRRYYRPADVDLLAGIKQLLHDDGMTIKGAQKLLREQGVKHVSALGAEHLSNDAADAPVVEAAPTPPTPEPESAPDADVGITNIVPLPASPAPGPKLSLNLGAKPETDTPQPAAASHSDIPADPSDADSKANARLFHLLHKTPHDKLAAQAGAIAPLLQRMQVLRDRIDTR